jgi:acetolactate synthase regulatory subunit
MNPLQIKKAEKNKILLKVVRWAQRKGLRVEDLDSTQVVEAIRCKL